MFYFPIFEFRDFPFSRVFPFSIFSFEKVHGPGVLDLEGRGLLLLGAPLELGGSLRGCAYFIFWELGERGSNFGKSKLIWEIRNEYGFYVVFQQTS